MDQPLEFRGPKLDRLIELLGRHDIGAHHFAEDLEACFGAYLSAQRGDYARGLPADVDRDLDTVDRQAADLAASLEKIPTDVARLIDLHVLSQSAFRRVSGDVDDLRLPLRDLSAAIKRLRSQALGDGKAALEDRLVIAIASAYRNRLKVTPTAEPGGKFATVLQGVFELAESAVPALTGLQDRIGIGRVAKLLVKHVRQEASPSRLQLLPEDVDLTIHEPPKMKPLFVEG